MMKSIGNTSESKSALVMNPTKRRRASEGTAAAVLLVQHRLQQQSLVNNIDPNTKQTMKPRRKSEGSSPDVPAHHPGGVPAHHPTNNAIQTITSSSDDKEEDGGADDLASVIENQFFLYKQQMEDREATLKTYCRNVQFVNMEQKARIHRLEQQVTMYQALTATSLSNFGTWSHQGLACDCTVANTAAGASTTFRLNAGQDDDGSRLIHYTPVRNSELLNPLLRESVNVDPEHLPTFLKDVLVNMFPEEEDNDDTE